MTHIPLPEPSFRLTWNFWQAEYKVSKPNIGDTDAYTADQMREYAANCVRDAMERAVKVCNEHAERAFSDYRASGSMYADGECDMANELARQFRALKEQTP